MTNWLVSSITRLISAIHENHQKINGNKQYLDSIQIPVKYLKIINFSHFNLSQFSFTNVAAFCNFHVYSCHQFICFYCSLPQGL